MVKLLIYGSLRKNSKRGHNFGRWGAQTYLADTTIKGFDMFEVGIAQGNYPAIADGTGTIQAELHEVDDETAQRIFDVEERCGYEKRSVVIEGETYYFFVMPLSFVATRTRTGYMKPYPAGDWK